MKLLATRLICFRLVRLVAVLIAFGNNACSGKEPLLSTSKASSLSNQRESGWVLSQRSQVHGAINLLVTKNAIKMSGRTDDYTFLMKAPNWRVVTISDGNRTMHESKADTWNSPFDGAFNTLARIRFESVTLVDKGKDEFQSVSCRKYAVVPPRERETTNLRRVKYKQSIFTDGRYLICDKLGVPPQVPMFLCKRYGIPKAPGFPISFKVKNEIGRDETLLATLRIKKATFPANEFAIPKYRLVKSSKEMEMDSSKMDVIKNLVDGLDANLERRK